MLAAFEELNMKIQAFWNVNDMQIRFRGKKS